MGNWWMFLGAADAVIGIIAAIIAIGGDTLTIRLWAVAVLTVSSLNALGLLL